LVIIGNILGFVWLCNPPWEPLRIGDLSLNAVGLLLNAVG